MMVQVGLLSGSMATGRSALMSGGTQTAGIIAGGGPGSPPGFSRCYRRI
jgi:hypothetical protein